MTDFARLGIEVDTRTVTTGTQELDRLTQAAGRNERATEGVQKEWVRASSEAGRLRLAAGTAGQALDRVTVSAGSQRAGMQQLSYQIGDVAQQFALGTNPMIIFAQQGQQVVQSLALMRGGASGVVGFLAGPWGAAIMGATMILAPFIARLFDSGKAAEDAGARYRNAASAARELAGAQNALKLVEAQVGLNDKRSQALKLETMIDRLGSKPNLSRTDRRLLEVRGAELNALRLEIAGQANIVGLAEKENKKLEVSLNRVSTSAGGAARAVRSYGGAAATAAKQVAELSPADLRLAENMATNFAKAFALENDNPITQAWEGWRAAMEKEGELAGQRIGEMLAGGMASGLDLSGIFGLIGGRNTTRLQTLAGLTVNDRGDTLGDRIEAIFKGKDGTFGKTMTDVLSGGSTGFAISSVMFGGNKGANIGGSIGGAIGQAIGGPLGGLIGGTLGSIVGKVFGKSTKTGSATIGLGDFGLGVTGTGGNNSTRRSAASGMASDIIGTLEGIAEALGGSADGPVGVSIGIRNKKFRVDTTGAGRTKGAGVLDFGKDQEAAIKAAIADAIADGAITGLSETMLRLLKGGDIERQLPKAQKFQGALDSFLERTDPLAFAFQTLTREFEGLVNIAREAGATTEEMAKIEELLNLKREDAVALAQRELLDKVSDKRNIEIRLLQLLGKESEAIAAAREMELLGLKESLQPLQQMVYQLEDARAIIDKFGPLADDLKAFRKELLGEGSAQSFAFLAAQFRATASLAAAGDANALGSLRGTSSSYLQAALANASTATDFQRVRGQVLAAVDQGIFAADAQVEYAQLQIDAIERQTNILASIRSEFAAFQLQVAENTSKTARILERYEADGLTVKTDIDTPIYAYTAAWP